MNQSNSATSISNSLLHEIHIWRDNLAIFFNSFLFFFLKLNKLETYQIKTTPFIVMGTVTSQSGRLESPLTLYLASHTSNPIDNM